MSAVLTYNLPLLAGAPNGIKKLRELILELAVRGKLVPQDANDEPASELLKRIAVEKEKLSTKVKKPSAISVCAGAFELPESWRWASFGDIAQHNSGKTLDKGRNSGVPRDYITTSNLYWGRFELSGVRQMLIEEKDLARCTAIMSDLLICEGGEAGRAAVWDQEREICFQNHVHRARFFCGINPHYAQRCFERLNYSGEIAEYRKGVGISNMSSKSLASIPVPLPPLAEQHRIVAKVDELMALCDRLEARQTDSDSAHAQLVHALLGSLTQACDAEDFAQSWQRLAEHFHALLTTESSIDALKQTLLQLAVMGKLVPQDPSDEPASELLVKRSNETNAGGVTKNKKSFPASAEGESLFATPKSWAWCRVGDLISVKHGYAFSSEYFAESKAPYILTTPGNFFEFGGFKNRGDRTKYFDGPVAQDFILEPGDLIVAMTEQASGLLGSVAAIPSDGNIYLHNQRLGKLIFDFEILCPSFVSLYFNSTFLRSGVAESSTGMKVKHTSPAKIEAISFPLPPLAEQHRIVSKLDQLMALCDQLKARLNQARQVHEHLASALVEQAVA
ncbi:restriction endonuclease subunit S [Pseudomonas sp. SID14000]|uniref:restriction endonuclease subunit S n=1 Tax=Pseudomonas sp. SID14000 TaxID=1986221 RepID=UPI000B3C6F23|nr:restriction endonuclease subunit S [Pseudomonas sp. SID14000]